MPDHHRVIEFLRDVRQGPVQVVTDEITHMAAEYAALCAQANDRLRQCTGFLQQGLRTEAIHLAEDPPNLLDLVAQLDLPDQQAWAEFCQNNGLAVPPPLQLERAAQLNEAYAQDQPLEHLMARHRLLALSRAPIRQRLDTLRKISGIDAGNATWEKDIRVFEKARLQELPSAFYGAVKNRDDQTIAALMDEINQQTWYEPVPADLSSAVADAYARMQRSAVEVDLQKLVEPLREAFAARSPHECQALVARWKNIMATGGVVQISSELTDEIRPVVAFIAEQTKRDDYLKRFKDACRGFTNLLDADATDAQLEAGYAKLKEFKEEIPEELSRRYLNKKTGRRKVADRGHKVKLLSIAGVAACVIIIGLVVVFLVTRSSAANAWADKINAGVKLHTTAGLDQAQGVVTDMEKNNAAMLKEPVVTDAVSKLRALQSERDRQMTALSALLGRIDTARTASEAVAAKPNASLAEIGAAGAPLQGTLNEARTAQAGLAWIDADGKLAPAIAGAQGILTALGERVATGARQEAERISTALAAIPAGASTPELAADTQKQIAALAASVNALRNTPLMDETTTATVAGLADRIDKRIQGAAASGTVAGELQILRASAGNAADLKFALESFIKKFPADPRTSDFKQALLALPPAAALESWKQLVATFDNTLAAGTQQAAQKRLDAVNAYVDAHQESPALPAIATYADYLRHAVDALADTGAWQNAFSPLLSDQRLSEVAFMEVSDGRRIAVLGDPRRLEQKINGAITGVSFSALDLSDPSKRTPVTIDMPLTVSEAPVPAPHARVVTEIADSLKLINEKNWDTFGIDWADRLAKNDKIDPVVRAILLQQALKTEVVVAGWSGGGGGGGIGDTYEKALSDLGRQAPENLSFLEPAKISKGTLAALKQIAESLPPAAAVKEKLAAGKAALFKSLQFETLATAVLLKDDAGAWQLHTRTPADGVVWTIVPGKPSTLARVGAVGSGKFTPDNTALGSIPQGSIAYITRP